MAARGLQPDAKPKYINTGETVLFSKGFNLYNFATARGAAIKAGTIIVAEGYMDVIALVRAGFAHAVAPLGTALTSDQLQLLWRTAAEPILAFDGDAAGLKAAHRAAHLALSALKAGYSLRFAFLPAGEDPDSFIARSGAMAMQKLLDAALPLSEVLWRAETEGKDFSTPERRAGLEHNLREIVAQITDGKIADYYRRDFDQKVFDAFKKRAPGAMAARPRAPYPRPAGDLIRGAAGFELPPPGGYPRGGIPGGQGLPAGPDRPVRGSQVKETELAALLLEEPGLAGRHGEMLAQLPFTDPSLDRLRHELLNLAASGSSLEKTPVLTHFTRLGMADLLARLGAARPGQRRSSPPDALSEHDTEARFLRAALDLRKMAEWEPERARALARFAAEGSEEAWREASRFLGPSNEWGGT